MASGLNRNDSGERDGARAFVRDKGAAASRRNAITGTVGNAVKLALTAPPVEGKANQAVIDFFADFFDIPRSSVTIASGKTSRLKVILVSGLSAEQLRRRLEDVKTQ